MMSADEGLANRAFMTRMPIDMHANLGHEMLDAEAEAPGFGDVAWQMFLDLMT